MKEEPLVLGVDDGPFPPFAKIERGKHHALIVGTLMLTPKPLWISVKSIIVDGMDVTEKTIRIVKEAPIKPTAVIASGVTFAGFNVLDVEALHRSTSTPVIVVVDRKPDLKSIKNALMKHFDDWELRFRLISRFYPSNSIKVRLGEKPVYYASIGMEHKGAEKLIKKTCMRGRMPEPIRLSGLIARRLTELFYPSNIETR